MRTTRGGAVLLLFLLLPNTGMAAERLADRARAIDGDTIVVEGVNVRLKGVAAPEMAHHGQRGEPGGEEARDFMRELVDGRRIVCDLTGERTHSRRVGTSYQRR